MEKNKLVFRTNITEADQELVHEILESTGFFHAEEVDIAVELVAERLAKGDDSGYHFIFAEINQQTVGYSCFGAIPATQHSYDLYWIGVHNDFRGRGIGKQLLAASETAILQLGGRRIYIETSGTAKYHPTRTFYLNCNYREAAVLEDFYAPGDAKYIYVKAF
jgi:ribosomal protein S18 acetylase RimI-like enzyme